jgi:hypothetical protein
MGYPYVARLVRTASHYKGQGGTKKAESIVYFGAKPIFTSRGVASDAAPHIEAQLPSFPLPGPIINVKYKYKYCMAK